MNQKVIITRGLSGSGKTTWSSEFVAGHPRYVRISRDDIDFMMSKTSYSKKKEKIIFNMRNFLIYESLEAGFNIVLDETYLVPRRINQLNRELGYCALAMEKHFDVTIQDFIHVSIEQCIERDKNRFFHVGEKFIRDYHKQYIVPLLKDPGVTKWTI